MEATNNHTSLITKAYTSFNARHIDEVLVLMTGDVQWPNGWEGGYVYGHEAIRDYWTRQWAELNPLVTPTDFKQLKDGRIETNVHQVVKDLQGNMMFDGMVKHIYTITGGLISKMEIEAV